MNYESLLSTFQSAPNRSESSPVLIVPYMWIGDFVRCHTVVQILKDRWPNRPVDVLTSSVCSPLLDYMPGVRRGIVWDLPRGQLAIAKQRALAARLREQAYATALIMPRTWKSALAPTLAGIPERIGFFGEARLGLINTWRWGERDHKRDIDRYAALALPTAKKLPHDWPPPQIIVGSAEIAAWRQSNGLGAANAVALAPGAVGPSKRWSYYAEAARALTDRGLDVWIVGGPGEKSLASEIAAAAGPLARDLTGSDLRNGILGLAAAKLVVSNDSGLLHVAAAIGTPTIGIFGPTSAFHFAPLNPLAAVIETKTDVPCRPCHKPTCRMLHHRCMRDIATNDVTDIVFRALDITDSAVASP